MTNIAFVGKLLLFTGVAYVVGSSFNKILEKYFPSLMSNPELIILSVVVIFLLFGKKAKRWLGL